MGFIPQYEPFFDESEAKALYEYMRSGGWVTEFKKTQEFEKLISEFTGARHCIVTNNCTISLTMALLAAGIKSGDEVLVPDMTMIATPNSCKIFGAEPVLVDVEPDTLCMDLNSANSCITERTRALIYVSLHGRCGDMEQVKAFCQSHNLFFLEDAAQAFGSYYSSKHLGRYGDIGTFSFSMPKTITTGQGGAIITDNDDYAGKIARLKDFGRIRGGIDIHDTIGYNFKFTDIQAVIGIEQMRKLAERINRKREIYALYVQKLHNIEGVRMLPTDLAQTTPWFVDIYVDKPDEMSTWLKEKGIGTRRMYPAVHTQCAYNVSAYCPNAELAAKQGLWLPSSVQLEEKQIDMVVENIVEFFK
ncbi:MAG: DegT/DnrJ/EryC1/StrS family aminotransferase [Nitrospirae bacterium]|nr:DegT/DnrJ/EryC1/StrS family aminotransferase [Nitrospirota bacterium]